MFSIVIPTRDRPEILTAAVCSVLAQNTTDYEVIIVDDGSEKPFDLADLQLPPATMDRVRLILLERQVRGRGPAYARNVGIWASTGEYCAFLDDDDIWVSDEHLQNACRAIEMSEFPVDLYISNQEACHPGGEDIERKWLYPLIAELTRSRPPLESGCWAVEVDELIAVGSFAHLNTTIVSRQLFDSVSGFDEYLSYEEDLDFYLRAIDRAGTILFCPDIVSRHHVPDKRRRDNVSTVIEYSNRMNIRMHLLNKNMLLARHATISAYCRGQAVFANKHLAEKYQEEGDLELAYTFAARALGTGFSVKWFFYCLYLKCKLMLSTGEKECE